MGSVDIAPDFPESRKIRVRRAVGSEVRTASSSRWSGGFAEWTEGDTAYLSIVFTWLLDLAYTRALWYRAQGFKVRVGGPALFTVKAQHELAELEGIELGGDVPDALAHHNAAATVFSRGCPVNCWFCIVPKMEGTQFTLLPDAPVRPVLCDNNLSALPAQFQDHIIGRYLAEGVPLIDANSGFEPMTFTPDVYARWKVLVNTPWRDARGKLQTAGPWRFAYDELKERAQVLAVMRMLADEPQKRKRVYVLIGNEPFAECMQRIQEVLEHGCEPHVQPLMKLNCLTKETWARFDWTDRKLRDVARWANGWVWKRAPFAEYDRSMRSSSRQRYDAAQGLFTFAEGTP